MFWQLGLCSTVLILDGGEPECKAPHRGYDRGITIGRMRPRNGWDPCRSADGSGWSASGSRVGPVPTREWLDYGRVMRKVWNSGPVPAPVVAPLPSGVGAVTALMGKGRVPPP